MPLWPGLVAGGVGIVGLAVGIPLVAINGKYTNCRSGTRGEKYDCADIYKTAAGGWTFTVIGIAGIVSSAILIPLHLRSTAKEKPRAHLDHLAVMPSSEGVVLGAGGRF